MTTLIVDWDSFRLGSRSDKIEVSTLDEFLELIRGIPGPVTILESDDEPDCYRLFHPYEW